MDISGTCCNPSRGYRCDIATNLVLSLQVILCHQGTCTAKECARQLKQSLKYARTLVPGVVWTGWNWRMVIFWQMAGTKFPEDLAMRGNSQSSEFFCPYSRGFQTGEEREYSCQRLLFAEVEVDTRNSSKIKVLDIVNVQQQWGPLDHGLHSKFMAVYS